MNWCFKKSEGNSWGLLCIWNSNSLVQLEQFEGRGYLGVKGLWGINRVPCFLINVYSPCNLSNKRILWEELWGLRAVNLNTAWCIMGDFNAVKWISRRKGSSSQLLSREMEEFVEFIEELGFFDLPLIVRKYTWHRANGSSSSRLDRFLISEEWIHIGTV